MNEVISATPSSRHPISSGEFDACLAASPPEDQAQILEKLNMVYLPEFQVLVCLACNSGLLPNGNSIRQHAIDHQTASIDMLSCAEVMNLVSDLTLAEFDKVKIPKHFTKPVPNLKIYENGSFCTSCQTVLTSNRSSTRHQCTSKNRKKSSQKMITSQVFYQHWWNVPNFAAIPKVSWAIDVTDHLDHGAHAISSSHRLDTNPDPMTMMLNQLRSLDQNMAICSDSAADNVNNCLDNQNHSNVRLCITDQGPFLQSMSWPLSIICNG